MHPDLPLTNVKYPDGNVVEFWSQDMAEYTAGARRGGGPGTFSA